MDETNSLSSRATVEIVLQELRGNFRMSNNADLVPVYKRFRQAGLLLGNKLVKSLDGETMKEGGRRLGILRNDVLVFGSEGQTSVLMDYCIYNMYQDGMNAVQRYLRESPPRRDSDEMFLLNAMLSADYSVFRVDEAEPGVGVIVEDLLRGGSHTLIDINLASMAVEGLALATRSVPIEGFIMTGGAGLPVTQPEMIKILREIKRSFPASTDLRRLTPDQESELVASIIRICLESDMGSRIAYGSADEPSSQRRPTSNVRAVRGANRNDPCPCGSGRKYKTCCGRRPLR
jgi:hypothetical protein